MSKRKWTDLSKYSEIIADMLRRWILISSYTENIFINLIRNIEKQFDTWVVFLQRIIER